MGSSEKTMRDGEEFKQKKKRKDEEKWYTIKEKVGYRKGIGK